MDINLAAFRLQALASLTSNSGSSASTSAMDFGALLGQAGNALGSGTGSSAAALMGGSEFSRATDVLSQLEASNASFLRRFNARVAEIGDESSVLGELRERVAELGTASQSLEGLSSSEDDAGIRQALNDFIARYNAWDSEFDPYFESGGLLDDNQAGEVARFSLKREVGSIFHGAGNGGYEWGLTDMGVSFTPDGQLTLDEKAFDAALADNREAAVQTLNNMARAFGDAAELLASEGHLLDRRIDNADRAVAWADENEAAIQEEFGPGAVSRRLG